METRNFGQLGRISALTLGGGGIAGVWGSTDRAEAVATVHAALDAGITMLDLAPSYGDDFESERAVGEALRSRPAPDVMITSKVQLPDGRFDDVPGRIRASLRNSLDLLGRDHLDLFLLHTQLRPSNGTPAPADMDSYRDDVIPDGTPAPADNISLNPYRDDVMGEFERLRAEGLSRGWGITAAGHPAPITEALRGTPRPDAAQVVVNAMDLNGDMWVYGDAARPDNDEILRVAQENSVPVIGIRAVAAGSLTATLDRSLDPGHPAAADFARAEPFRKLAAELGRARQPWPIGTP